MPDDYLELQLCLLFHCLPSQLDNEDANMMERLWFMYTEEQRIRKERKGKK